MIFVDYPTLNYKDDEKGQVSFQVFGDPRLSCRMRLIPSGKKSLPALEVETELDGQKATPRSVQTEEGHLEYELFGGHTVYVKWPARKSYSRNGKE